MAHRVYHWRHGWIPLDAYALQKSQHQAAISQVQSYKSMSGGIAFSRKDERVEGAPHVTVITQKNVETGILHDTPIVTLDQPTDEFTSAQKREVAQDVESVFQRFPGLHGGLDQEVEAVAQNDSYWGATDAMSRKHKVALSKGLWDPEQTHAQMADWSESHGAIAGQTRSMKEFRRRTVLHEMGHVIHLRARDQARMRNRGAQDNPIDELAFEPVTPRQMGFTKAADPRALDMQVPRYMADSLDRKSAYASSNEMEWFAEAFLDGMVNGSSASESGKRAVAIGDQLFGKAAS